LELTNTVPSPIDESCGTAAQLGMNQDLANFPKLPDNLVEADSYQRLIVWLRIAASTHDALKLLTNSAAAFYLAHHSVPLQPDTLPRVFGGDDPMDVTALRLFGGVAPLDDGFATAFADLSVTGRAAFASFSASVPPPTDALLISLVHARMTGAGITKTAAGVTLTDADFAGPAKRKKGDFLR
jgi:hypothetical protein